VTVWHKTAEYTLISEYYRNKHAARSGVPYLDHIKEGIKLLIQWNRPEIEQRAFALHPLAQAGQIIETRCMMSQQLMPESIPLALEYAQVANSYLCDPKHDRLTMGGSIFSLYMSLGDISTPCAWMLLADKVQNQSDFRRYHWFDHPRARELEAYFNLWIGMLRYYYCK
jgi:hypothetical protein